MTTITNEAADVLQQELRLSGWSPASAEHFVAEALAAERRATVEKVRVALEADLDIKVTGTFWRRMSE